ncbi:MAG: ATP-binding protein [Christensenellaceae bacterium]|nr:ATP-binding protein [Christensenellaceae bacterium]
MRIKSQNFIKVLNNEISERRRRMRKIEHERKQEVYLRVPEILRIDAKMKAIALDMGRQSMAADNPDEIIKIATSLIDKLREERNIILTRNGYSIDYLDKQYVCSVCKDTGRIGKELCRCVIQLAINTAFEDSGLNPNESFNNFNLDLQRNQRDRNAMSKIRDLAEEYASSFPNCEKRDLLYFGEPGVGKTYLLNCIGVKLLERGFSVLKISAYKLIQLTLDTLKADPDERPDYLLPDFLIIDDLGTEPMIQNITIETLLSVLCQRQDSNKATAFATNLNIGADDDQVESIQSMYGQRFASRLIAPREVRIQAVRTTNVRLSI